MRISLVILLLAFVNGLQAQGLQLGSNLQDSMVIQQNRPLTVWGTAPAGGEVAIKADWLSGPVRVGVDDKGAFEGMIPVPVSDQKPHVIEVSNGAASVSLRNVLIGEVWICSGQSNMQFAMKEVTDSTREVAAANYPDIRLLNVSLNFSAQPIETFKGKWVTCTPATARGFSAVGYYFGRETRSAVQLVWE